jgi:8-hydroxy-5-deazaflavin:NADPH oxidoreductase
VPRYAVLGGTGALGFGLALRLASAGFGVTIGSRVVARARSSAAELVARVPGADAVGLDNTAAARAAERVVLAFPAGGLPGALEELADPLAGKIVIDVMVALEFRDGRADLGAVTGAASVGELVQRRMPSARVVSAFKNLSAGALRNLAQPLVGDVLVCGEDASARAEVAGLVSSLRDLRAVDAGALVNVRYVEAITALLVNLNRQHRALTSVAILGLPR